MMRILYIAFHLFPYSRLSQGFRNLFPALVAFAYCSRNTEYVKQLISFVLYNEFYMSIHYLFRHVSM